MKILINYANDAYQKAQSWNSWTGKHIAGFDKVYSFGPSDIDSCYLEKHKIIFDQKRGNGLWLWKPYFIDKVLSQCNDGDIVFYADSGSFFVKKIDNLIASMKENEKIWVSDCPLIESCFTKKKCFIGMDCDNEKAKKTNQIQATYLMVYCCDESKAFIKQWLSYCENPELLFPEEFPLSERKEKTQFVAHREDQSILSLLCKKKGIRVHKDPSQRAKYPETFYNTDYTYQVPEHNEDHYGTVLFLHKAKKPNILTIMKFYYLALRCRKNYKRQGKKNNVKSN